MSEEEFNSRLRVIQNVNKSKERKLKLKEEKNKFKSKSRAKHKFETTKLFASYLFVVFNVILIYALIAMWHFGDLTYLSVIITDIAAQILIFGIYCFKAYKGKKQEEIMKFENMKFEKEQMLSMDDVCSDLDNSEAAG